MTIAEGVLRLVRSGSRTGRRARPDEPAPAREAEALACDLDSLLAGEASETLVFSGLEPGFADIEAAVALVESGLAKRVVLHGFASWPGLLWRSYQLSEAADVTIVPCAVHPGGRVDIAITRNSPIDG
jgi:hypothetical protein